MASKLLDEYRQRYGAYCAELNREKYLYFSGRKAQDESRQVESEFSDLFTRAAMDDLRAALEATESYRETEREAVRLLIAIATEGYLRLQVRDLSAEIQDYEARAMIEWAGQTMSFEESASQLASEADAGKRRDLFARRANVIKGANDLRAERLEKLHEAARELGYQDYLKMFAELRGFDYEPFAAQVQPLLARTESQYVNALSPLLAREANVSLDDATQADVGYLQRLTDYDQFFALERLRQVYSETLAGLGIRVEKQTNLEIDDQPQPPKRCRSLCAAVRVPDEIKLVVRSSGGAAGYQTFLHEAGHAQRLAWTSRNLYPEFRYGGDGAVSDGFAFLLGYLVYDAAWLADLLGFAASAEFLHKLAVYKLLRVRRCAAKLTYETELHAGKLAAGAGARYAELMTGAVRVRYDETDHLRDVDDAPASADVLRAWAFEAQLREYLKTKYGQRWWASRKAGELLIDVWNTGGRYGAEELAKQIGLGDLSYDWLASELVRQLGPKHLKIHS